ncbi:hypothetical protein DV515_00001539 [Chloebia gouldiae]|uniref:26S proteasome complex subunit SEM1 n=1 Tax=Chloebia gouldiae TaxID=44316 RepID=A0A3L8SZ73_CHLGU|nr:hypothetical protein DV515_00001539 [Chloebia gouldiae]
MALEVLCHRARGPRTNWTGLDEDEDAHVWEDNWDDDNVEDDFSNQLRTVKDETSLELAMEEDPRRTQGQRGNHDSKIKKTTCFRSEVLHFLLILPQIYDSYF